MKSFKQLQNPRGFSLIEILIAVGIMSLIVYAMFQLPAFLVKSEKQVSSIVTKDRVFKSFSQKFIEIAERSDLAARFLNLPVPSTCADGKPCIRKLTAGGAWQTANLSGIPNIQFFRDERGILEEKAAISPGHPLHTLVRPPYSLDAKVVQEENYATWPLIDDSSEPFVMMRRSAVSDHFFMVEYFVVSSRTAPRWLIVRAARKGVAVEQLKGKGVLIYNANDFSQYAAQKVEEAIDCSRSESTRSQCLTIARSLVPSFDEEVTLFEGVKFSDSPVYAFRLQPFSKNDLQSTAYNFLPSPGMSPSNWRSQPSGIYLFPTDVPSIFEKGASHPDLTSPLDAKRFAHYFHTLPAESQGKLVILPFDLLTFRMELRPNSKGPAGLPKKALTLRALGDNSFSTVLDDIANGEQLVFGRRLGRSEIAVFHMSGEGPK